MSREDNIVDNSNEKTISDNFDSSNSESSGRRFVSVRASSNNSDVCLENKNLEKYVFVGILEIIEDNNYGFLRNVESFESCTVEKGVTSNLYKFPNNINLSPEDIYVSPVFIKNFNLRSCDVIECIVQMPNDRGKFKTVKFIKNVNFKSPSESQNRKNFDKLTPIFPNRQIKLSTNKDQLSTRIVDLFSPIGFGQRGMIVAQPKSGKTMLLKDIANGITTNYPDIELIVLLIGERPEEVTDMIRSVKGVVIASTFDETPERQAKVSMFALERAKRSVENGKDVVILMDSITRLARAYNAITPSSGKILSGGIEMNALYYPKRFFGAARNFDEGGSLTIIATALVDTGSKMDDVIFEEFKGTGNMELSLNRSLSNRRIYPAIDVLQSGTRRDDLLLDEVCWNRMQILRKYLNEKNQAEAIEFLKSKMQLTNTNDEFLQSMNS